MRIYGVTNNGFAIDVPNVGEFDVEIDYWVNNARTIHDIFDDFEVRDFEIKNVNLNVDKNFKIENVSLEDFFDSDALEEIEETVQQMILKQN